MGKWRKPHPRLPNTPKEEFLHGFSWSHPIYLTSRNSTLCMDKLGILIARDTSWRLLPYTENKFIERTLGCSLNWWEGCRSRWEERQCTAKDQPLRWNVWGATRGTNTMDTRCPPVGSWPTCVLGCASLPRFKARQGQMIRLVKSWGHALGVLLEGELFFIF